MQNRRVFQRADCRIPVVIHLVGRFLYGDIVDLSLGGVRLCLQGEIEADKVQLSPKKPLPNGMVVIPLPYEVRWQDGSDAVLAGLQFAGGTDSFFRGWLSDHLNPLLSGFGSLLDQRKLVRMPCQLEGLMTLEGASSACAVLDLSLGGASFVVEGELLPGRTVNLCLNNEPSLESLEIILLRVQSLSGHSLCGGRFLDPTEEQERRLAEVIDRLAEEARKATLDQV